MDNDNLTENNVTENNVEEENYNVNYYGKLSQQRHYRRNKINA